MTTKTAKPFTKEELLRNVVSTSPRNAPNLTQEALSHSGHTNLGEEIKEAKMTLKWLFEQFLAIYDTLPNDETLLNRKKVWFQALTEANVLNKGALSRGLKQCRQSPDKWLPKTGQFIAWCKPSAEELGLPSLLTALREAIKNCREREYDRVWTHEIVYWAYLRSNTWLLLHAANETVPPDFRAAYEELAAKIANGEALAPIPKVIAPKMEEKRDTQTGRAALEALKALFNKKD